MPLDDSTKKYARKRGPVLLDPVKKRSHCVSVRLNASELEWLDSARAGMQRGKYLRLAAMNKLPPSIPAINCEAWISLGRALANLNQLTRANNMGESPPADFLAAVLSEISELRPQLLGSSR